MDIITQIPKKDLKDTQTMRWSFKDHLDNIARTFGSDEKKLFKNFFFKEVPFPNKNISKMRSKFCCNLKLWLHHESTIWLTIRLVDGIDDRSYSEKLQRILC